MRHEDCIALSNKLREDQPALADLIEDLADKLLAVTDELEIAGRLIGKHVPEAATIVRLQERLIARVRQ